MRNRGMRWGTIASTFVFMAMGLTLDGLPWRSPGPQSNAHAVIGGPKVKDAYERWVRVHEAAGGDRNVSLSLGYHKALSTEFGRASGKVDLDLVDGRVEVQVEGLPEGAFEVWAVDNRPGPGRSVGVEPSDLTLKLGRLARNGDEARLSETLPPEVFDRFQLDLMVVAPVGAGPERGLLYGSLPLFQRLYTVLRRPSLLAVSDYATEGRSSPSRFGISVAQADEILVDPDVLFDSLVATGADLFINETFAGNGRTCASCHPAARNTQLSSSDVAEFPDNDPLFVAEFLPALAFSAGGPKFEVPVLMRGAALIVENQDGMDDLTNKFNLRGIPHTLGLPTSLAPSPGDGTSGPVQRTGWSGDGAPDDGSLRAFATGAVTQHFPLSLNRVAGVDFRLPTDPELDAMEAFQLSLGRQADLVLPLTFLSPIVERGQEVFMSPEARCNGCHSNAGANVSNGTNRNFNTGVEDQVDRPTQLILEALNLDLTPAFPQNLFPRDGGFGATPGDPVVGFGNGTFNTPPLVEAADSGPFFHDNQIRTIEGAVAFYNGTAFANSPVGNPAIDLQPTQIEAVAAFLRAINALENIRSARELAVAIQGLAPNQRNSSGPPLLAQAAAEVRDAVDVLAGADLHPDAVADLFAALADMPENPSGNDLHPSTMADIISALDQARGRIVL